MPSVWKMIIRVRLRLGTGFTSLVRAASHWNICTSTSSIKQRRPDGLKIKEQQCLAFCFESLFFMYFESNEEL